jgi:hypothetical protein
VPVCGLARCLQVAGWVRPLEEERVLPRVNLAYVFSFSKIGLGYAR